MAPNYASRIAALHHSLGIPANYASTRNLALQPEASAVDLVTISSAHDAREIRLILPAATAWQQIRDAAQSASITLLPISGFRSVTRQAEIIRAKLGSGLALTEILRSVAAPGYSEHHTGRALDLSMPGEPPLEETFGRTLAFNWLSHHARTFGFALSYPRNNPHGVTYEPWHWCWHA